MRKLTWIVEVESKKEAEKQVENEIVVQSETRENAKKVKEYEGMHKSNYPRAVKPFNFLAVSNASLSALTH